MEEPVYTKQLEFALPLKNCVFTIIGAIGGIGALLGLYAIQGGWGIEWSAFFGFAIFGGLIGLASAFVKPAKRKSTGRGFDVVRADARRLNNLKED